MTSQCGLYLLVHFRRCILLLLREAAQNHGFCQDPFSILLLLQQVMRCELLKFPHSMYLQYYAA